MNRQHAAWKKLASALLVLPILAVFLFAGDGNAAVTAAPKWSMTLSNNDPGSTYNAERVSSLSDGFLAVGHVSGETSFGTWIMKLDKNGTIQWNQTYDGLSVTKWTEDTVNGAILVIGTSQQTDNDTGYQASVAIIMQLSAGSGEILWQQTYSDDTATTTLDSLKTAAITGGQTTYNVTGVQTTTGAMRLIVMDINPDDGSIISTTATDIDTTGVNVQVSTLNQLGEGGYIGVGVVSDGSTSEAVAMKLTPALEFAWGKSFSSSDPIYIDHVRQTKDKGFLATGRSSGQEEQWFAKLDGNGNLKWIKKFKAAGSNTSFFAGSLREDNDGGFIAAGSLSTQGTDPETSEPTYSSKMLIVKLDASGAVKWQNSYGGASGDYSSYDVRPVKEGGYILAGNIYSSKDDSGSTTTPWIARLDAKGMANCLTVTPLKTGGVSVAPIQGVVSESITVDLTSADQPNEPGVQEGSVISMNVMDQISDDGSCRQYAVTVNMGSVNNGMGTVAGLSKGKSCKMSDESCSTAGTFWPGDKLALTAAADKKSGSIFAGWFDSEGVKLSQEAKYSMTVSGDENANTITASFSKPVAITGVVTDAKGAGIAGVTITVSTEDPETGELTPLPSLTGKTIARGKFSIKVPAAEEGSAASYVVSASKTGYSFTPSAQSVEVGDADAELGEYFVGHIFSVTGSITKSNADGDEVPAAKATVKLLKEKTDANGDPVLDENDEPEMLMVASVTANAKGIYTFAKVPAGEYIISAKSSKLTGSGTVSVSADTAGDKDVVSADTVMLEEISAM